MLVGQNAHQMKIVDQICDTTVLAKHNTVNKQTTQPVFTASAYS